MSKKNKFLIENLYDASKSDNPDTLNAFDEAKLRRSLEGNKNFMANNKDIFAREEPKFHTCKMYDPCPICNKCKVKASHLWVRCQNCKIPNCVHSSRDIAIMIRRHNFLHYIISPETKQAFRELKNNIKLEVK